MGDLLNGSNKMMIMMKIGENRKIKFLQISCGSSLK